MNTLYRGVWPQNVARLAKFGVKSIDGIWKVAVLFESGQGLQYLAVEGGAPGIAEAVNAVKLAFHDTPGGAFYVNEYRHIIVPVRSESVTGSDYYYAGGLDVDFQFEFEGQPLTTRPVNPDGTPLTPGDRWVGPRPGIPYVLAAGGGDIYYETPALTDTNPPAVIPSTKRKVLLSKVIWNKALVAKAVQPIAKFRGHLGGRFYVNEHGALFTPVDAGDGNGLEFIYCGQIQKSAWFPEPNVPSIGTAT